MTVVLVLLLLFALRFVATAANKAGVITSADVGLCPPHKWKPVEIKDKDGNTVRWTMVCDLCGPLGAAKKDR